MVLRAALNLSIYLFARQVNLEHYLTIGSLSAFNRCFDKFAVETVCAVLAGMKQIMPSKAADNCDLLAAVLSVCGDIYISLAHCVDTGLQTHCDELTHWPRETADIIDFIADESATSGAVNVQFCLLHKINKFLTVKNVDIWLSYIIYDFTFIFNLLDITKSVQSKATYFFQQSFLLGLETQNIIMFQTCCQIRTANWNLNKF